jgi:hypothetical protein
MQDRSLRAASDRLTPAQRRVGYVLLWAAIGLLQSLAALQAHRLAGGTRAWDPFVLEGTSVLLVAMLAPAVFALVRTLSARAPGLPASIAVHALGALAFSVAHVAGMYALRFAIYAFAGEQYRPRGADFLFGHELAKDLVTYAIIAGLGYGLLWQRRQRERAQQVLALQAALREARLGRLREQLQPHFLFNALNLVSSLMHVDVERADQMLARLADLLRGTLELGDRQVHPLHDELRLLEPFLDIMAARFGERLRVEIAVDDAAGAAEVPCLLLLPIVENAIRHGVESVSGDARVTLAASLAPQSLTITVTDDAGVLERDARPGGIGLENTRARLSQMYGEAGTLSLQALAPRGVAVTLCVPRTVSQAASA